MLTMQAGFDRLVIFIFVVVEKRVVGLWREEKAGRWRVAMVTVSLTSNGRQCESYMEDVIMAKS